MRSVSVCGTDGLKGPRQKEQPKLMWLARRASSWLLAKLKERRTVKVQAHEETCKKSGSWNRRDRDEVCCIACNLKDGNGKDRRHMVDLWETTCSFSTAQCTFRNCDRQCCAVGTTICALRVKRRVSD